MLAMAGGAFNTARSLFDENPLTDAKEMLESSKNKFTHWSQYVLIVGSVVAAVSAVAMAILSLYVPCGIFAALAISQALGAYYFRLYMPTKSLQDMINTLDKRVKEIYHNARQLEEQNKHLSQSIKEAKELEEEHKKKLKEIEATFGKNHKELESAILKLSETEKEKQVLNEKYEKLQKQVEKLTGEIKSLIDQTEKIDGISKQLTADADRIKEGEATVASHIDNLEIVSEEMAKTTTELGGKLGQFTQEFSRLKTLFGERMQELQELRKIKEKLDEADDKNQLAAADTSKAAEATTTAVKLAEKAVGELSTEVNKNLAHVSEAESRLIGKVDDLIELLEKPREPA